jgi:hypothetical protein
MDTKLIIKITTLLLLITVLSCTSIKGTDKVNTYYGDNFFYPGSSKGKRISINYWVISYKRSAFYQCLFQGYKNDSIYKLAKKEDLFFETIIPIDKWDKIRADSKKIADNMPVVESHYDDELGKKKKYISATCLCYFASRELDSIAKEEYKLFRKDKNNKEFFE